VPHLTAALGAAVAISRAVDALLRPGETWQAYRKASAGMKREYRLYLRGQPIPELVEVVLQVLSNPAIDCPSTPRRSLVGFDPLIRLPDLALGKANGFALSN
jgi:hypothetical protein